ncbi:MAG: DUF2490 domain-containing protein [Bacteroidales bacterium]|nr:DUF2490 domain-containing protein [Bacteroidales bacterium]
MRKLFSILFCCFIGTFVSSQTHSFQVWTGIGTSVDISKKLSIDFEAETRFQQIGALIKQASAEIDATYNITKPLFISAGYKFADKYKKNGYFPVHTISAAIGYKKKFGDFRIGFQTKLNLEKNTYIKNNSDLIPTFLDKNKLKVTYSGIKKIKPSVFVETYHPLEAGSKFHIETVKYGANVSYGFRKHLDLDLGYIFRHEVDANEFISIATISLSKSF